MPTPSDLVRNAADGRLPEWTVASDERRAHMGRVAELMGSWADALSLDDDDRFRWCAAGRLHDVLRDERPELLRPRVPPVSRGLPGPVLHGPAAAERLRVDGVLDGELLAAVAHHTVGSADFGPMGRALYAADFLEPGRTFLVEWRGALRERVPEELDDVVRQIVGARIAHRIEGGGPVLPRTFAFWNALALEAS